MNKEIRIATIVTCFNRCDKTIKSLQSLINAMKAYNNNRTDSKLQINLFLTDDGCTDNTITEVQKQIAPVIPTTIIKGNGNLYWAGGMRAAWSKAIERPSDYYLLLNDDTFMFENAFQELFRGQDYCKMVFGKEGLCSGITCAPNDFNHITYGGNVWIKKERGLSKRLRAIGEPQHCDLTNANMLFVSNKVVESVGIFYEGYVHGKADYDYAIMANMHGFNSVVTANICGFCDFDHRTQMDVYRDLCSMSLKERKAYFENPLHSNSDYIKYIERNVPQRLNQVKVGRWMNLYCPHLYLLIFKFRMFFK